MITIDEWPAEECLAVYRHNLYMEREAALDDTVIISCKDESTLLIQIQRHIYSFHVTGSWEELSEGDVVSISNKGRIHLLYKMGQSEIDLFITNKCNSNCIMCPLSELSRKKMIPSQYQWIKEYIHVLPPDIPYINITGGEPTLDTDKFQDILKNLKKKFQKSQFQLLTNGRSFSDTSFLKETLCNIPNYTRFAVPIHSAVESVHDRITQSPGSFRQTDRGIKNLLKYDQKVEVRIVLSKINIPSLRETVEYIANNYRGIFVVNFVGLEMMGNAARNKDMLWMDYKYLFHQIRESILFLICRGIDTQLYNFPLCAIDKGFWPLAAKSITDYKIRYKEECNDCMAKPVCGGFFSSTLKLMNPEVKVIQEI